MSSYTAKFDNWIRSEFVALNSQLEELYWQQADKANVEGVGDSLKLALKEQGNALISDFLRYSRPAPLRTEPVNLSSVIQEVAKMSAAQQNNQIQVDLKLDSDAFIRADPAQLTAIVWNLWNNAMESMGASNPLEWTSLAQALRLGELGEVELDLEAERANPSLGVPETALLRRINKAVNPVLDPPDYRPLVRELLAHQTLSRRTRTPRLALPPDLHEWARDLGQRWNDEVRRRGYDVVGDLADLEPGPPPEHWADPDSPRESQVSGAAVEAIRALLVENARMRAEEERLRHELHEARVALDRSFLRPSYRVREKALRGLRRTAVGRGLHRVYRVARGRSSRSA